MSAFGRSSRTAKRHGRSRSNGWRVERSEGEVVALRTCGISSGFRAQIYSIKSRIGSTKVCAPHLFPGREVMSPRVTTRSKLGRLRVGTAGKSRLSRTLHTNSIGISSNRVLQKVLQCSNCDRIAIHAFLLHSDALLDVGTPRHITCKLDGRREIKVN